MTAILENHESVARAHPTPLVCQFRADPEMVERCQKAAVGEERFWRGRPLGAIRDLWPWGDMKMQAMEEARLFVHYMRQQRQEYELVGAVTEMELWGPYRQKVDWGRAQERLTRTDGDWNSAKTSEYAPGYAYGFEDKPDDKGLVFLIRGQFLGKYGKLVEGKDGVLLV
jgi:hypothetical protein